MIERGCVVRKISFENVRLAIVVIVADSRTHAGLLAAIFVEGNTDFGRHVSKSPIFQIVIQNAGRAVARDIDVRPTVIVVVESGDAQAIMAVRFLNAARFADIFELSSAQIVIENVRRRGQAARPAHHRRAFPNAQQTFAWLR